MLKSFEAADKNGARYTLYVHGQPLRKENRGSVMRTPPALLEFQTEDGLTVAYLGKGEYMIQATGLRLYSDDPNAP